MAGYSFAEGFGKFGIEIYLHDTCFVALIDLGTHVACGIKCHAACCCEFASFLPQVL